jgi:hypothetical protein
MRRINQNEKASNYTELLRNQTVTDKKRLIYFNKAIVNQYKLTYEKTINIVNVESCAVTCRKLQSRC